MITPLLDNGNRRICIYNPLAYGRKGGKKILLFFKSVGAFDNSSISLVQPCGVNGEVLCCGCCK